MSIVEKVILTIILLVAGVFLAVVGYCFLLDIIDHEIARKMIAK